MRQMDEMKGLLSVMVARSASDLYVNADARPTLKIGGQFHALSGPSLSRDQTDTLIRSLLDKGQQAQLAEDKGLDFALGFAGIGRFRVNVYFQKGGLAMVVRFIKDQVPAIEELGLPDVLHDLVMQDRGLVLIVGATGTGKSTTLAAMIDYRNSHREGHILTIEDPIEYIHPHKLSLISQREIGIDTHSYADALRYGLREAPDVIMIGEIRDAETARQALRYAETGHLCLSTLHANNACQALDRLLNCFPAAEQVRARQDIAHYLLGIISQRVAQGLDGSRVTPVELLINSAYIAELIEAGEHDKIKVAMSGGDNPACRTFDDSLYELILAGRISRDEGMRLADSRVNLALRFKLGQSEPNRQLLSADRHWLSATADFTRLGSVRVIAPEGSRSLRPDREAQLALAIEQGFMERGYRIERDSPDLLVRFCLKPGLADPLDDEAEDSGRGVLGYHAGLLIEAVQARTGAAVWKLRASQVLGQRSGSQQELNVAVANLMSSLPLCNSRPVKPSRRSGGA